jgi:hypothetical protein
MTLRPVLPIVEDFAAIHARLREIEAADRPAPPAAGPAPQEAEEGAIQAASQPVPAQYADFYGWLTGGVLQAGGA